jgi:hypothetical protein
VQFGNQSPAVVSEREATNRETTQIEGKGMNATRQRYVERLSKEVKVMRLGKRQQLSGSAIAVNPAKARAAAKSLSPIIKEDDDI